MVTVVPTVSDVGPGQLVDMVNVWLSACGSSDSRVAVSTARPAILPLLLGFCEELEWVVKRKFQPTTAQTRVTQTPTGVGRSRIPIGKTDHYAPRVRNTLPASP